MSIGTITAKFYSMRPPNLPWKISDFYFLIPLIPPEKSGSAVLCGFETKRFHRTHLPVLHLMLCRRNRNPKKAHFVALTQVVGVIRVVELFSITPAQVK
ncbi:hypothetical protein BFW01_g3333 [Lasiodiplodia theobromae]|nr:hypothetical protein BFW01_g3333 [Lasiodiplodia theobromae]